MGTTDDPTVFSPAPRELSSLTGSVTSSGGGIPGVEITLIGTDVFGNAVELTTLTDANGNYSFNNLNAGTYQIVETQPDGFNDGPDSSDAAGSVANDQLNDITLGFGQNLGNNNFTETLQGTSGSPARLPPIGVFSPQRLSDRISGFLGGPGPIYAGVPIASNSNPLTLDSGRRVTGGYATQFATPETEFDYGCPEIVETVVPCETCEAPIIQDVVDQCEVCEEIVEEATTDCQCQSCEEFAPCDDCSDCGNCCECGQRSQSGFLFRFKNWLSR